MIRHIVCFKLKDHSEEACETARDILLSMKDNVPLVREISLWELIFFILLVLMT